MAIENRQKLINLHTSGTTKPAGKLELGEIAVQHDSVEGARLFIDTVSGGTGNDSTLVEFVPKSYVDAEVAKVSSGETALEGRVDTLEGKVTTLESKVDVDSVSGAIATAIEALDVVDSVVANQFVTAVSETDGKVSVTRRALTEADIPTISQSKVSGLTDSLAGKVNTSDVSTATTVSEEMSASTKVATEKLVYGAVKSANATAQGYVDAVDAKLGDGFSLDSTVSEQLAAVKATADAAATDANLQAEITRAKGVEAVLRTDVDKKVASVSGANAIQVTTGTTPTVSLKLADEQGNVTLSQDSNGLKASVVIPTATVTGVKSGDKVLSLSGTELTSTISLTYESGTKKINLTGIDNEVIASIDATAFIKDGMVQGVSFNPSTKKLTITFNTDAGTEPIEVDLTSLVDTYTAGNGISISGNVVSAKVDESTESFLTVGTTGIKLAGVQNAIDAGVASAKTYADSLEVSATGDAYVAASATGKSITISATTKTTESLALADTALQTVRATNDGTYVSISGAVSGKEVQLTPSVTIQAVSGATGTTKGLAEASDVKDYVDSAVAAKNVTASGDAYVEAEASGNKVTVNASASTIASLGKADSAVQSITVSGVGTIGSEVSGGVAALDFSKMVIDCGTY